MNRSANRRLAEAGGIAIVAALAWLVWSPGGQKNDAQPSSRAPAARLPGALAELPAAAEPDRGATGPLSAAELRWCMTEEIRLDTIQPLLTTRSAADRYNELAAGFNLGCSGRSASGEGHEAISLHIAESRDSIETAAREDALQLNDAAPILASQAEELLSMLGYDPGAVDGEYGPETLAAIQAFQRGQRIPVDGLLSQELLHQLGAALARLRIRSERCRIRSLSRATDQEGTDADC